jgi:hypothetical protein
VIQGALNTLRGQQPLVLTEAQPGPTLFALAYQVAYRVFAYIANKHDQRKSFAELLPGRPSSGATKMLFLVPPRLAPEFEKIANS